MKMYRTIAPNAVTVNANGTSRSNGTALTAIPHGPKPPRRKRRF